MCMPRYYARGESSRDKTLERITQFLNSLSSQGERAVNFTVAFCSNLSVTEWDFFFFPTCYLLGVGWMDLTTTGKWHRHFIFREPSPYSLEHSNLATTDSRNGADGMPHDYPSRPCAARSFVARWKKAAIKKSFLDGYSCHFHVALQSTSDWPSRKKHSFAYKTFFCI